MRFNQANGHGTLTSPLRGLRFVGQWQRDLPQGKGKMSQMVGSDDDSKFVYKGQFDSGVREGQGICLWPSGSHYIGHFAGNKKHGTGVFEWPEGSTFDGTYLCDLRDGAGVFHRPRDEENAESEFEELEIWKKGELLDKEQSFGTGPRFFYMRGTLMRRGPPSASPTVISPPSTDLDLIRRCCDIDESRLCCSWRTLWRWRPRRGRMSAWTAAHCAG